MSLSTCWLSSLLVDLHRQQNAGNLVYCPDQSWVVADALSLTIRSPAMPRGDGERLIFCLKLLPALNHFSPSAFSFTSTVHSASWLKDLYYANDQFWHSVAVWDIPKTIMVERVKWSFATSTFYDSG